MYSIIKSGGMQFLAEKGKEIKVPLMKGEVGSEIEINDVLLFKGKDVHIGKPVLEGAKVKAKIVGHGKNDKVTVFKKKRRKRFRRTKGHRQDFTKLEVLSMEYASEKQ